jgi:hypothetical protein
MEDEGDNEVEWRRKRVWDTAFAFAMVTGRSDDQAVEDASRAAAVWGVRSVCDEHRELRVVPNTDDGDSGGKG